MASLEPVAARLVRPGWVHRVPSPAHDSLDPAGRRRHVASNPDSYLTVTRSPEDLPPGAAWSREELLGASRASLDRLLSAGAFSGVTAPALHLYQLATADHAQVGVVGLVAVDDYDRGTIRIHEQHVEERAALLADQLDWLQVQSSPIALAHRPDDTITSLVSDAMDSAPALDFVMADGPAQRVWRIDAVAAVERLRSALADEPLYLIDGHHRAAAASRHRQLSPSAGAESMLGVIFPADHLLNHAFHRRLQGIDVSRLLVELGRRFEIHSTTSVPEVVGRRRDELALLTGSTWHLARLPLRAGPPSAGKLRDQLDPTRLQQDVLGPILSIDGSRPDSRLSYVAGAADEADLARLAGGGHEAVWVTRPVPVETLMAIADAGLVLPPKSTYFVPKVRSGIFLRHLGAG